MAIVITRVDDRLIHGQVATSWIRGNNIEVVVVVDDKISNDDSQKSILKLSAPSGIKVYIQSVDKFIEKYSLGILDKYRVMLVLENISTGVELVKKGLKIESINLGGMRFRENKIQISKALSVSENDIKSIKELESLGIEVEHRQLSTDSKINVIKLIEEEK